MYGIDTVISNVKKTVKKMLPLNAALLISYNLSGPHQFPGTVWLCNIFRLKVFITLLNFFLREFFKDFLLVGQAPKGLKTFTV